MNNMLLQNINTNEMVGFEVVDDYFSGVHNIIIIELYRRDIP